MEIDLHGNCPTLKLPYKEFVLHIYTLKQMLSVEYKFVTNY